MSALQWKQIAWVALFSVALHITHAGNPFSSNVIALNSKNWRDEVEDSPHAVFVNFVVKDEDTASFSPPEWEKLAAVVKGTAKIAYWDSEQRARVPTLLGEIKGTPTIRLFKPKTKQGNSNRKKDVVDYQYERKAKDMKRFLDGQMPTFIEHINGMKAFSSYEDKATRNGLPRALLFTSKANTSSLTKYLSIEFRRRLLLAEIYPNKNNKSLMETYGITNLPALIVIPPAGDDGQMTDPIRYEKDDFSRIKLVNFLSKHALKKPVLAKKTDKKKDTQDKKGKEKEQLKPEPKVEL
eukprot:CAMPEP_0172493508 /NCGR_PEP_ID=MMETSP1066-20121228/24962_1 /TAXON_ID=671091 /ORGANISM="Coscinodiscus wailesii, Strain CCMP2513" /LENGTH=294 /DNA_ID=CAMNT_0013263715 /DNA_START=5 /DNA_END=889 /DNA_ORIENTATION=-